MTPGRSVLQILDDTRARQQADEQQCFPFEVIGEGSWVCNWVPSCAEGEQGTGTFVRPLCVLDVIATDNDKMCRNIVRKPAHLCSRCAFPSVIGRPSTGGYLCRPVHWMTERLDQRKQIIDGVPLLIYNGASSEVHNKPRICAQSEERSGTLLHPICVRDFR